MASAAPQFGETLPPQCWRVVIAVPPGGLGGQLGLMRGWLDRHCGASGWAAAPSGTGGIVNDALAFYFADLTIARAFVERFSCGYRAAPQHRV